MHQPKGKAMQAILLLLDHFKKAALLARDSQRKHK
jgi:hypothetical protein